MSFFNTLASAVSSPVAVSQTIPKRLQYAKSFRCYFDADFRSLIEENKDEFLVTHAQFDEWLAQSGFASYSTVPQRGTPDWDRWVNERNKIRTELNEAARYGEHGEPPYRVDFDKGHFIVRNMTSMVRVTFTQVAGKLAQLADNKGQDLQTWLAAMKEKAAASQNPYLMAQVGAQERAFHRMIATTTSVMNGFMDDTSLLQDDINTAIPPVAAAPALTDQSED